MVEPQALDAAVQALAEKIAAKLPNAVRMGKQLFYRQLNQPLDVAYQMASETITCNFLAADTLEGVDAFIEKRKPNWHKA